MDDRNVVRQFPDFLYLGFKPYENVVERQYVEDVISAFLRGINAPRPSIVFAYSKSYVPGKGGALLETNLQKLIRPDRHSILIWLGDERGGIDERIASEFTIVFRAYLRDNDPVPVNARHFPPGLCCYAPELKWSDRKYSVFFSGYPNDNRLEFVRSLSSLKWVPLTLLKSYVLWKAQKSTDGLYRLEGLPANWNIQLSGQWSKGLTLEQYGNALSTSKICLCPPGFHTSETYRHIEAISAGCIPISWTLPNRSGFYDCPAIEVVDRPRDVFNTVASLLSDPESLEARHNKIKEHWDRVLSPNAVANYMLREYQTLTST